MLKNNVKSAANVTLVGYGGLGRMVGWWCGSQFSYADLYLILLHQKQTRRSLASSSPTRHVGHAFVQSKTGREATWVAEMTSRGWMTEPQREEPRRGKNGAAEEESLYNVDVVPFGIPGNDLKTATAGGLVEDKEGTLGKQRQLLDQLQFISIICGIKNI